MKKTSTILATLLLLVILISCSSNGNKATTSEAKEVKTSTEENINSYSKVYANSFLKWRATHLGGVNQRFGKVFIKNANISIADNKIKNAKIVIDLNSLTVESFPEGAPQKAKLTGHLKSADFFNTAKYPTARPPPRSVPVNRS